MAKDKQINLRLDDEDCLSLKRVAERERRSEQEILRDSFRNYAQNSDEQEAFLRSVERGWCEIQAGLGEVVEDDDDFFDTVKRELRDEETEA